MIDLKKPLQTRDGREVKIFTTECRNEYWSIVGEIKCSEGWNIAYWKKDGTIAEPSTPTLHDLINVPEKPKKHKVRVNFLKSIDGKYVVATSDHGCVNWIASKEIEFEEGENL